MHHKRRKIWLIRSLKVSKLKLYRFVNDSITFRGGLELIELKKGQTVRTFIPKVAEGVFTIICLFNKTDEYVLYYHSGKKTLRVFRYLNVHIKMLTIHTF